MNGINIHIYPSPITHETRIMKETLTISELDCIKSIFIIGIWEEGLSTVEEIDSKRTIIRYKLHARHFSDNNLGKAIKFSEWIIRIFFRFLCKDLVLVNIHNLGVLPLGALFKIFKKTKLVYDTHELETERNGWHKFRIRIARLLERLFVRFVDQIIVVSPSIEKWYKSEYDKPTVCILNTPKYAEIPLVAENIFRERFKISSEKIIFLYQGTLEYGRGIENILSAFKSIERDDLVIVFLGYGLLKDRIVQASTNNANIFYHPPVDFSELLRYTSSADVAFALIENTCLSYYYSLPNKIFEYTMAEVPVISTDMAEIEKLINKYNIGFVVEENNDESLIKLLMNINFEILSDFKENLKLFKREFNWENEEKSLYKFYNTMFQIV